MDLTGRVDLVKSLTISKELSVSIGAELMGINRTSVYYKGLPVTPFELECKAIIDALHMEHPT